MKRVYVVYLVVVFLVWREMEYSRRIILLLLRRLLIAEKDLWIFFKYFIWRDAVEFWVFGGGSRKN